MKFDSPEYIYRRTFYLPVFSNDFDAAFFPEGGPLSPVLLQNIAFKILGADGLSREAAGYVLNARGDTLMHRHYKIFCVNVKYGIQYGFRIFYLIALQNEENYEREESCSA